MSAEFRVVLVDEGTATPPNPGNATTTELPPGPRVRQPEEQASRGPRADRWKGTPRDDRAEPGPVRGPKVRSATEGSDAIMAELKRAVTTAADVLGAGGLTRTAISLAEAFQRLFRAITAAGATEAAGAAASGVKAAKAAAAAAGVDPLKAPKPSVGRKAPDFVETIDAEFEVKGTKAENRGLIVPPSGLSTRHARTTVETLGVTGAKAAAPVAGASPSAPGSAGIMARLAAAAGPAAIAIGAVAIAAGAAVVGIKKLVDVFDHEADRLQGFNAQLAGAKAFADLRNTMNDMRRAQRIGPGLAGFTDRESRFNEAIGKLGTEVLDQLLKIEEVLAPLTENAIDSLNAITELLPMLMAVQNYQNDGLKLIAQVTSDGNSQVVKLLRKVLGLAEDAMKPEAGDDFMDAFLGQFAVGVMRNGGVSVPLPNNLGNLVPGLPGLHGAIP